MNTEQIILIIASIQGLIVTMILIFICDAILLWIISFLISPEVGTLMLD